MCDSTLPKISATISLEPKTYSFSSSEIPMLNLTLRLSYQSPITIYADDLSPSLMLRHGAFDIHYRSSGAEVQQTKRTYCRIPPPTKVNVELDESMFLTLQPHTPYTFSSPFCRSLRGDKPRSASELGDLDDRRRRGACGVDGLEPGYDYMLSLTANPRIHWRYIRWWEYGTKEQVLYSDGDTCELDARRVKFGRGPRNPIKIDTSNAIFIEFRCEE